MARSTTDSKPPNAASILATWRILVEEYSHLDLTDEMDCLPALSGIASVMYSRLKRDGLPSVTHLAGLWSSELPLALCWICTSPTATRPARYRAPSLSWASINGPISFLESLAIKRSLGYAPPDGFTFCQVVSFFSQSKGTDPYGGFQEVRFSCAAGPRLATSRERMIT